MFGRDENGEGGKWDVRPHGKKQTYGPLSHFPFFPSFLPLPNLLSDLSVLRTLPVFGDPSFHIFGGKLTTNLYEILCLTNVEMPSCPPSSWLFNNRAAPFIIK